MTRTGAMRLALVAVAMSMGGACAIKSKPFQEGDLQVVVLNGQPSITLVFNENPTTGRCELTPESEVSQLKTKRASFAHWHIANACAKDVKVTLDRFTWSENGPWLEECADDVTNNPSENLTRTVPAGKKRSISCNVSKKDIAGLHVTGKYRATAQAVGQEPKSIDPDVKIDDW